MIKCECISWLAKDRCAHFRANECCRAEDVSEGNDFLKPKSIHMLIHAGNVEDIKNSLHHAYDKLSIADLRDNIDAEKTGQKRSSVIKLLEAAISKKQKEGTPDHANAGYQPKEIPLKEISQDVKQLAEDALFDAISFLKKPNQPPRIKRQKLHMADFWFTLDKIVNHP
jgi:hypothetical protein